MADVIYDPGEIVFEKGEESLYAFLLKSGEIEILEGYPEEPVRIARLREGDIFGEMGLIDERPRNFTARAIVETRVSKIDRLGFVELIKSDPEEAFRYLKMFFERLRVMNMKFADTKHNKAEKFAPKEYSVFMRPDSKPSSVVVSAEGIEIESFPFRVGRASKHGNDPFEVNDLTINDKIPYNVSRNHFAIEKNDQGVYIHDRGSFVGTIVNGEIIGGHHREAWVKLKEGENHVVAGSRTSPFRFRIDVGEPGGQSE